MRIDFKNVRTVTDISLVTSSESYNLFPNIFMTLWVKHSADVQSQTKRLSNIFGIPPSTFK